MAGVVECLTRISDANIPIGLATSSSHEVIETVLQTTGVSQWFDVTNSALDEENGKPDPAVYLSCCGKLSVRPEHCLAIEDTCTGMMAALNANMQVVVVPTEADRNNECFSKAHKMLHSLTAFRLADFG